MINKEFYTLIREIVKSDEFCKMKKCRHHIKTSAHDHSIKVAWLCYLHAKRFGTKTDIKRFLRGALLHDFYLYDRSNKSLNKHHSIMHPKHALNNAKKHYCDLCDFETDMIANHMFPLTLTPPKTREGWIVCFYDKVAAVSDFFGDNKWKRGEGSEIAEELCPYLI